MIGRLYPGLEIRLLEKARHHLVNEEATLRLQVFQLIEGFLKQPARKP